MLRRSKKVIEIGRVYKGKGGKDMVDTYQVQWSDRKKNNAIVLPSGDKIIVRVLDAKT